MPSSEGYWFAPVLAAPVPELPERVAVGVVFGNGTLQRLEVDKDLPRLKGIVSGDHRRILELLLDHAAAQLSRAETLDGLRAMLGVQFSIPQPTPLSMPYSMAAVRTIRRAYLNFRESPRARDSGLLRESLLALDHQVEARLTPGMDYLKRPIDIADLYAGLASRYETAQIGALRRVVQGQHRHLILSSVIIRESDKAHVDAIVLRATRQSYFLNKLRNVIRDSQHIDYRFVGVVQPLDASATNETRLLREFYQEQWERGLDTVLAPTSMAEARDVLVDELAWARDAA